MKVRAKVVRTLGLGTVTAMLAAGLGAVTMSDADAVEFPDPTSPLWLTVEKASAPLTDGAGEVDPTYLDLTPAGGALGNAVAFVHANLQHAFFRFHVAALPEDGAAGGYIVQFDTDNNLGGWERALRYDQAAGTVTFYSAPNPNSAVTVPGTVVSTLPLPAASRTKYAGADGGAHVAFALTRASLASAGISLGVPMVIGATTQPAEDFGAALNATSFLGLGKAKADILGVAKSNPSWQSVASDPLDIDSDGDGIADNLDNCPIIINPEQEDDDKDVDNSLSQGTAGQPDGTEGDGNVCDATPRGYDFDGDDVGLMDDQCPEQYGALENGCVAQSTTKATLRYLPKAKTFKGVVRAAEEQCVPRRNVTVFKQVAGPDRNLGTVKTDATGRYAMKRAKRATKGTYYARVDPKWTLGARCFNGKSPKIVVR